MYYLVFNKLFVCLIIFTTSHIGSTVSQEPEAADPPAPAAPPAPPAPAAPAAPPAPVGGASPAAPAGDAEELKNLREQYNALKTDNEYLKQESLDLNRRADELQNRLDVLERLNEETARVNRRNNVVVYGIPNSALAANEKANALVKKLGDAINFPLTDKDIVDAYRLTSSEKGLRHGGDPLLIKFTNTDVKDLFMKKMKLQDINAGLFGGDTAQKLFVNEHLTKQASAVFREALALKSHGYPYIWTKNGHVYAKKVGDDMPSVRVESIDQANQMLREARGEKNLNEPNPPPS